VSAADAAIVSGCFPPFVCIIPLLYLFYTLAWACKCDILCNLGTGF
jgi:hypothetical protein